MGYKIRKSGKGVVKLGDNLLSSLPQAVAIRIRRGEILNSWFEIVGHPVNKSSRAVDFQGDKLIVICSSGSVAQHISLRKRTIIDRIRMLFGDLGISDISTVVGKLNDYTAGTKSPDENVIIEVSSEDENYAKNSCSNINDPETKESLEKLVKIYITRFKEKK